MTAFAVEPQSLTPQFDEACRHLDERHFADALWARRLDVWTSDAAVQAQIGNRLGWLSATGFVRPQVSRLQAFAQSIRHGRFTDVVLLGMGGSSLGPEVLRAVVGVAPGFPRFRMLDSVDPTAVRDAMEAAGTSLFVLASKSGGTIEPNVMAAEARRRVEAAGIADWGSRFVAITDENTALHRRAQSEHFRDTFINPGDIGGRYSTLSLFGMVPAALMGIDLETFLNHADQMAAACRAPDARANPGLALGALMASGADAGRDKLTLLLPEALQPFGLWVEQLVAESTGKRGKGVAPIAGERAGVPFGSDRTAVAARLAQQRPDGEARARDARVPLLVIDVPDPMALGAEFMRWEVATAAAGFLLGINPFDEPNVQQAKDATRELLDVFTKQRRLPLPDQQVSFDGARLAASRAAQDAAVTGPPARLRPLVRPADYVALLVYLPPGDGRFGEVLQQFRTRVSAATGCATTLGYGPRYLHSTGQLHKGGPNNGVFLIVTAPPDEDLDIPGEPYSFGILEMAQATGDFQSLDRAGRRALHVHLPRRDPALLQKIADELLKT